MQFILVGVVDWSSSGNSDGNGGGDGDDDDDDRQFNSRMILNTTHNNSVLQVETLLACFVRLYVCACMFIWREREKKIENKPVEHIVHESSSFCCTYRSWCRCRRGMRNTWSGGFGFISPLCNCIHTYTRLPVTLGRSLRIRAYCLLMYRIRIQRLFVQQRRGNVSECVKQHIRMEKYTLATAGYAAACVLGGKETNRVCVCCRAVSDFKHCFRIW